MLKCLQNYLQIQTFAMFTMTKLFGQQQFRTTVNQLTKFSSLQQQSNTASELLELTDRSSTHFLFFSTTNKIVIQ